MIRNLMLDQMAKPKLHLGSRQLIQMKHNKLLVEQAQSLVKWIVHRVLNKKFKFKTKKNLLLNQTKMMEKEKLIQTVKILLSWNRYDKDWLNHQRVLLWKIWEHWDLCHQEDHQKKDWIFQKESTYFNMETRSLISGNSKKSKCEWKLHKIHQNSIHTQLNI